MKAARRTKGTAEGLEKAKYKKKNLISLVWSENTCYSTLIAGLPKGVTVDLFKGTWAIKEGPYPHYPIGGQSRHSFFERPGFPINVYDKTEIEHLRAMKRDIEWVRERSQPCGD